MKPLLQALSAAAVMLFATTASADPFTYVSTDTPLAVPPAGTSGTTTSTLVVGPAGIITDLNVTVDITHTFTGDLDIFLKHVDTGTEVLLFDQHGGAGNDIGATFDDEAATAISLGAPPYAGSFRPDNPLSAFDGESTAGTWTLRIVDNFGGDSGTLHSWSIHGDARATTVPEPACMALLVIGAAGVLVRRRRRS